MAPRQATTHESEGEKYGSFRIEQTTNDEATLTIDMDDAIERLGMGKFQNDILLAAGLCFSADAMEVLLLSFLSTVLKDEWDLTEREENTIISMVFAGAMVGTLILSPLGDIVGRRPVFTFTAAAISIFGIATAFTQTYEWLLFTRFMVGFGVGGLTVPFDTLAEFVPTSKRGTTLLQIEFFWTGGTLLVPIIAWYTLGNAANPGSWQLFVLLCAIPCVISTLLGLLLVPESPRWLVTKSKQDEAVRILRFAAARNGLDPLATFPEGTSLVDKGHAAEDSGTVWDLFSPKWLRITLLLWGTWFGLAFLYYGVIIAVTLVFTVHLENDDDQGNYQGGSYEFDYAAIFISASAEIVGLIIVFFTIDTYGRINTQAISYLVGGGSCLLFLLAASANGSRPILLILAFFSRMAMMGSSCTTWVSTSEILSTEIRATGHGSANAMARLGGFFCPYIINESTPLNAIGIFIFAVSVLTAKIAWQLPETAGLKMGEVNTTTAEDSTSIADKSAGAPYQQL